MPKYRKKPVVIEAEQWFPDRTVAGVRWERRSGDDGEFLHPYVITAHEQRAYLAPGDWIIPEPTAGRFYPCKPDIFEATYDRAATPEQAVAPERAVVVQPALYTCKHGCERDMLMDRIHALESAQQTLPAWPEYDTDIADAFDGYSKEKSQMLGNGGLGFSVTERMSATFRWHEVWDRVGEAIAKRSSRNAALEAFKNSEASNG